MMRNWIIFGAAMAILTPAAVNAQTTCRWVGSVWTCDQQPKSGVDWGAALRAGQQDQQVQEQRNARMSARISEINEQEKRKKVGKLVAAGDCDGARKLALKQGDFDLAKQVDEVCRP